MSDALKEESQTVCWQPDKECPSEQEGNEVSEAASLEEPKQEDQGED